MASHQNSRALPEHGTFHIQGSLSSHVAHEPACRTVDHHNHAFDRLSITIPNDFQLQTAEPVPFRGLFHEAYLAQVPTQHRHSQSPGSYENDAWRNGEADKDTSWTHGSNPSSIGFYHSSGSISLHQEPTVEEVIEGSLEDTTKDPIQHVVDGMYHQVVPDDGLSAIPDVYYNLSQGTPGTQLFSSSSTMTSNACMDSAADVTHVPRLNTVPTPGPWSELNTRHGGGSTFLNVTNPVVMQQFQEIDTDSGTFTSTSDDKVTDSVRSFARDVDDTTSIHNLDESMSSIPREGTDHTFTWTVSSGYSHGHTHYGHQGHTYPQFKVFDCLGAMQGNDNDGTVSQYRQPQNVDDCYLSARSTSVASYSEASSPASMTSLPNVLDVIRCAQCDAEFQGEWSRGNYNRHRRLYHRSQGVAMEYPCGDPNCPRVFRRQDSRLKHHRRRHPNLRENPPRARRGSRQLESE